jgi:hypothetical protein
MSAMDNAPNLDTLFYRVKVTEEHVKDLRDWRSEVDKEAARRQEWEENLERNLETILNATKRNTQVLIGFVISVALAAVAFAFTALAIAGKIGT